MNRAFCMSKKILETAQPANKQKNKLPSNDFDLLGEVISPHKYAMFREVYLDDQNQISGYGDTLIKVLLVDGDKSIESQWQTPFENSNPEHKLPTLMAAIQSGQLLQAMTSDVAKNFVSEGMAKQVGEAVTGMSDMLDLDTGAMKRNLEGLKGRTNLTKVNTQQVFLSTSSVRLNLTLSVIAVMDAVKEVERKIMQLEAWALPRKLSTEGILTNKADNLAEKLFPSEIPPFIGVTLQGKTYSPFIIETVSSPIVAPIDSDGNRLNITFSITLLSRTAWDANDVKTLYGVQG